MNDRRQHKAETRREKPYPLSNPISEYFDGLSWKIDHRHTAERRVKVRRVDPDNVRGKVVYMDFRRATKDRRANE